MIWKAWITVRDPEGAHYIHPYTSEGESPSEAMGQVLDWLRLLEGWSLVQADLAPQDECYSFPVHAFKLHPQFLLVGEPVCTKPEEEPIPPLPTPIQFPSPAA